jgi:hypothetical protein
MRSSPARAVGVAVAFLFLLAPRLAAAFCGFYVSGAEGKLFADATQVVMMREGTRTVLAMQNDYKGPAKDFAMVVPVPVVLQKENVKTLSRALFASVDALSAPRLVEYWEQDPCPGPGSGDLKIGRGGGLAGIGGGSSGAGLAGAAAERVKIEAQFAVGEYEILILSAQDSGGLDAWLRGHGYAIPENAEPALRPYVQAGSKFFVAKVDITKVKFEGGHVQLSPLRFHFDADTFTLPVRLGMLNSSGTQDLIVHILAPRGQRYAVANYPSATIPTNLDVAESARKGFSSFYAALFDKTLEKTPRAVVTEYAWGASSCDPCPNGHPGLTTDDLASLGADVLPSASFGPIDETARVIDGPIGTVSIGALELHGPPAGNDWARVMASVRPRLRSCYRVGLNSDPSMSGSLKLKVAIAPSGEVSQVDVLANTGLSPSVAACAQSVVRRASFSSPSAAASVVVPLAFVTQNDRAASPTSSGTVVPPRIGLRSIGGDFVLTRLHTRYARGALADDLVFKAAGAIYGGRENRNASGELETGATASTTNAFQGRYAIRHPWAGAVTCETPVRGVWGGPWPDAGAAHGTTVATQLAYAPRGLPLASFVPKGVPELAGIGAAPSAGPAEAAAAEPAEPGDAASASATSDGADGGARPALPGSPRASRCGCAVIGAHGGESGIGVLLGLVVVALRLRRRRESRA